MRKKRTFLLLELMIGLFLVSLCSSFLILDPIHHATKELQALKEIDRQRQRDLMFMGLIEEYSNKDLDKILQKQAGLPYPRVWCTAKEKDGKKYYLLHIRESDKTKMVHHFFIKT